MLTHAAIAFAVSAVALYHALHSLDEGSSVDIPWLLVMRRMDAIGEPRYAGLFLAKLCTWVVLIEAYTLAFVAAAKLLGEPLLSQVVYPALNYSQPSAAGPATQFLLAIVVAVWLCRRARTLSEQATSAADQEIIERLDAILAAGKTAKSEALPCSPPRRPAPSPPAVANASMSKAKRRLTSGLLMRRGPVVYLYNWLPLTLVSYCNFFRCSYGLFLNVCAYVLVEKFGRQTILAAYERFRFDGISSARMAEVERAIGDRRSTAEELHIVLMGMLRVFGYGTLHAKLSAFCRSRPLRLEVAATPELDTRIQVNDQLGSALNVSEDGRGLAARLPCTPSGASLVVTFHGQTFTSVRLVYAGHAGDQACHGFEIVNREERSALARLVATHFETDRDGTSPRPHGGRAGRASAMGPPEA